MSSHPRSPANASQEAQSLGGMQPAAVGSAAPPPLAMPGCATLSGKNIGLLCEDPAQPEALLVCRAVIELGARVSLVRPRLEDVDAAKAADTARILGRLYDAVACVALPPDLVQQLRERAGIPVLDDSSIRSSRPHPAPLAHHEALQAVLDDRKVLWQRALVDSLG
jgi:ornithine carbamoyltransferase